MPATLETPILITGTPRSGKSCVGNVLREAPEFEYLREPMMIWDASIRGRKDDCLTAADANEHLRRRIRQSMMQSITAAGKERYLDNLAHHALRLPFIRKILPEAKVIHVVRDPSTAIPEMTFGWSYRDSVGKVIARRRNGIRLQSLPRQAARFAINYVRSRLTGRRSSWGPRVSGMREVVRHGSPAELAAHQWAQMVRIAREHLVAWPDHLWMEIRFEDMINEPGKTFHQIAQFADVRDVNAIARFGQDYIVPDRPFDRRIEPSTAQWESIWERIRPVAKELGYTSPIFERERGHDPHEETDR